MTLFVLLAIINTGETKEASVIMFTQKESFCNVMAEDFAKNKYEKPVMFVCEPVKIVKQSIKSLDGSTTFYPL
jgi:hypothetical protein